MLIPTSKSELKAAIKTSFEKLIAEFRTIPSARADEKTMDGHAKNTKMSAKNLAAYLVGWGLLVLKWSDRTERGLAVDWPETGFKWNELGLLAQKFYADRADARFEDLLDELTETTAQILALIEQKNDRELYETPFFDRWPLGKMIQLNTASPFKNALARLRKWKKSKLLDASNL